MEGGFTIIISEGKGFCFHRGSINNNKASSAGEIRSQPAEEQLITDRD